MHLGVILNIRPGILIARSNFEFDCELLCLVCSVVEHSIIILIYDFQRCRFTTWIEHNGTRWFDHFKEIKT